MLRCKLQRNQYGAYYHPVASWRNTLHEVEASGFYFVQHCCCNLQQGGNTRHTDYAATCNATLLRDKLRENVARITSPLRISSTAKNNYTLYLI